jgi:hypothetical protein
MVIFTPAFLPFLKLLLEYSVYSTIKPSYLCIILLRFLISIRFSMMFQFKKVTIK